MWELAVIGIIVVLLILILVVVVGWISSNNCCRKNRRHLELLECRVETGFATLQAAQTVCCTKAFLTSVGGATVDRLSGMVKLVTWSPQTMNELPDAGWVPVFSTVDSSLIGWTVPLNGTYFIEYETWIATTLAAALFFVNGQFLLRSLSASTNSTTEPLQKSFLLNLVKGDIVSLLILNLNGAGITPPVETGASSRYLHTLTLDLRDAASQSTDPAIDAFGTDDAQNVEQWISSVCVQQAITNGATCASTATTPSDQLNCINSTLANLELCSL